VAALLQVERHELHVVAMSRGSVAGLVQIRFGEGPWIECANGPSCGKHPLSVGPYVSHDFVNQQVNPSRGM